MRQQGVPRFVRRDERKAIGGVSVAVAEGIGMPLMLTRILFAISVLAGFGIPLYAVLWFITPRLTLDGELISSAHRVWAIMLIMLIPVLMVIGVEGIGLDPLHAFLFSIGVGVGGILLRRGRSVIPTYLEQTDHRIGLRSSNMEFAYQMQSEAGDSVERIMTDDLASEDRSSPEPKLGGVCAWLARTTGLNVSLVRVMVVIATVVPATFPLVPFLYGVAIFFVPRPERAQFHGR